MVFNRLSTTACVVIFWVFVLRLSDESQEVLLPILHFFSAYAGYNVFKNFIIFKRKKFVAKEYVYLSLCAFVIRVVVVHFLLQSEYNIPKILVDNKNQFIGFFVGLFIGKTSHTTDNVLYNNSACSNAYLFVRFTKTLSLGLPTGQLIHLLIFNYIAGDFVRFVFWIIDFVLYGKLYIIDKVVKLLLFATYIFGVMKINKNNQLGFDHLNQLLFINWLFYTLIFNYGGMFFNQRCYTLYDTWYNKWKLKHYSHVIKKEEKKARRQLKKAQSKSFK